MTRYERPNIAAMSGYSWGEQPQDADTIKLNTNENPYPPSPAVQAALDNLSASALRRYPQPTADPLRDAIASHHGLERHNVVVTNGGDEALRLAITTFVEPAATFAMADPSYSLYAVLADVHDARVLAVPLDGWNLPEDFAERCNDAGAQLICLVNPHAPSGSLLPAAAIDALAQALDGVLLVDEAYADFVDPAHGYDSSALVRAHDNVLVLRTFSKGYSLAGLRLGYLLGPAALIEPVITKTRDSYNIDHVSQQLGLAAISDQPYARETWRRVREDREALKRQLHQLGLPAPASETNFLLVTVPPEAALSAAELYAALKAEGVLVRYFSSPPLDDRLRISVGTPEENARLTDALTRMLTS